MIEKTANKRLINLLILKSKLSYLMSSLQNTLEDSEPTLSAFELKTLLLLKLDGFCSRHFHDCECIE